MPRTEAMVKAQHFYQKKMKQVKFWLNPATEYDLIQKLEEQQSKSGYIKKLIREDIRKDGRF